MIKHVSNRRCEFVRNKHNRPLHTTGLISKILVILLLTIIFTYLFSPIKINAQTSNENSPPYNIPNIKKSSQTIDKSYLFDTTVTWADGRKETIQIDSDGFFRINGIKTRLIGMHLGTHLPYGELNQFYLPENIALLDKELEYLKNAGFRLIRIELPYVRWWLGDIEKERAAWKQIMDLLYSHKMLVIVCFIAKWMPNFSNLENPDFSWDLWIDGKLVKNADSISQWAMRFADLVSKYPNVVAVQAENELDYKLKAEDLWYNPNATDQNYTPSNVQSYLELITGIFRKQLKTPIIHNLMTNRLEPSIKKVTLNFTDVPAFDCYADTPINLNNELTNFLRWIKVSNGWWCLELNCAETTTDNKGAQTWTISADKFTTDYINTVFNNGATIAILFWSNETLNPDWAFFTEAGDPKSSLIAVAKEINKFQTPTNDLDNVMIASLK